MDDATTTDPARRRAMRDLVAVLLMLAGLAAILTAAYIVAPPLALAVAGVAVLAVGIIVGTTPE